MRTAAVAGLALALQAGAGWAGCAPDRVDLRTAAGAVAGFTVEIADSEGERAHGLMDRDHMATSSGMLFVYEQPRHAYFWMKNTLIPLDMIFADAAGRVSKVHEGAVPLDETTIDGGPDVTYVLEINGGLAGPLGIGPGTVMRSAEILQTGAAWPCDE